MAQVERFRPLEIAVMWFHKSRASRTYSRLPLSHSALHVASMQQNGPHTRKVSVPEFSNTTEQGNAFRDRVASLLRTVNSGAETEVRISGTAIDIVFDEPYFGRRMRTAVECKDYQQPLTKTYIEQKVYPKYSALLTGGHVHHVLVVSRRSLGPDAQAWFDGQDSFKHYTYQRLAEELLGLRPFLESLAAIKPVDDIPYVEGRFDGCEDSAFDYVQGWLNDEKGAGLAILAGYGCGKTSFANRLVSEQARRYLVDATERLPIILRLGQVVHETELEGICGKQFIAREAGRGLRFETLMHLNESGRLLVVLDGFDEMKHAMTLHDFKANFLQFNRLLVGNAKVLLLGRPSALTSESHDLVLRGLGRAMGLELRDSRFSQWREMRLAKFEAAETRQLLSSSLSRAMERNESTLDKAAMPNYLARRVDEVMEGLKKTELLSRPVHIGLVAMLAANLDFRFDDFNEYHLYDHFIGEMIERDTREKRARQAIGANSRKQFQRELAWWSWTRESALQGQFDRDTIPETLLEGLDEGNAGDREGQLNEYLVSSLTEEKDGGILYFAHRSFQEFLVAQRLLETMPTPSMHAEYSRWVNDEIMQFIRLGTTKEQWDAWCNTLDAAKGPLTGKYFEYFEDRHPVSRDDFWTINTDIKAERLAASLAISGRRQVSSGVGQVAYVSLLERMAVDGSKRSSAIALLLLTDLIEKPPANFSVTRLLGLLFLRCLHASKTDQTDGDTLTIRADLEDAATTLVGEELTLSPDRDQEIVFNVTDLRRTMLRWLSDDERYLVAGTWYFSNSVSDNRSGSLCQDNKPRELSETMAG